MTSALRHRVEEVIVDCRVGGGSSLGDADRLADCVRRELLPALEVVCDELGGGDRPLRIGELVIDLGIYPAEPDWDALRADFEARLRSAISAFASAAESAPSPEAEETRAADARVPSHRSGADVREDLAAADASGRWPRLTAHLAGAGSGHAPATEAAGEPPWPPDRSEGADDAVARGASQPSPRPAARQRAPAPLTAEHAANALSDLSRMLASEAQATLLGEIRRRGARLDADTSARFLDAVRRAIAADAVLDLDAIQSDAAAPRWQDDDAPDPRQADLHALLARLRATLPGPAMAEGVERRARSMPDEDACAFVHAVLDSHRAGEDVDLEALAELQARKRPDTPPPRAAGVLPSDPRGQAALPRKTAERSPDRLFDTVRAAIGDGALRAAIARHAEALSETEAQLLVGLVLGAVRDGMIPPAELSFGQGAGASRARGGERDDVPARSARSAPAIPEDRAAVRSGPAKLPEADSAGGRAPESAPSAETAMNADAMLDLFRAATPDKALAQAATARADALPPAAARALVGSLLDTLARSGSVELDAVEALALLSVIPTPLPPDVVAGVQRAIDTSDPEKTPRDLGEDIGAQANARLHALLTVLPDADTLQLLASLLDRSGVADALPARTRAPDPGPRNEPPAGPTTDDPLQPETMSADSDAGRPRDASANRPETAEAAVFQADSHVVPQADPGSKEQGQRTAGSPSPPEATAPDPAAAPSAPSPATEDRGRDGSLRKPFGDHELVATAAAVSAATPADLAALVARIDAAFSRRELVALELLWDAAFGVDRRRDVEMWELAMLLATGVIGPAGGIRGLVERAVAWLDRGEPGSGTEAARRALRQLDGARPPGQEGAAAMVADALRRIVPATPSADSDAALHTPTAGLVLIAAHLPTLFTRLGLVEGRAFLSDEARCRGVDVLQSVAFGREDAPPYPRRLERLLCGVPDDVALPAFAPLDEPGILLAEDLLRAVIAQWPALGRTTVAGLREAFLRREGFLKFDSGAAQLTVPPGPFDMLLDSLPWSVSLIRLPWMTVPLKVGWRT